MYLHISPKIVIPLVSPLFKSNRAQREGSQNIEETLYIRISTNIELHREPERRPKSRFWQFWHLYHVE